MRGRGNKAVSDDIELLDVEPIAATLTVDHVETASNNRWGAAAAVALCLGAAAFVVGVGNSPAPVEPPDVTINEDPAEIEPPLTEQEQLEDQYGVAIGDGPDLDWQPVEADADTRYWQWVNDRFVADNGTTETSISLVNTRPALSQQPSISLDYPGYRVSNIDGGQLLIPSETVPDHLIVLTNTQQVSVPLPDIDWPTNSLFKTDAWAQGAIVSGRLVVQVSTWGSIDIDELRKRTGQDLVGVVHAGVGDGEIHLFSQTSGPPPAPISFEDAGLTQIEVVEAEFLHSDTTQVFTIDLGTLKLELVDFVDLQYVDEFVISPTGELLVGWTDTGDLRWNSSSLDGRRWTTVRSTGSQWLVNSGTQLFDRFSQSNIERSSDGGASWDTTTDPLRYTARAFAGDVVALGPSWDNFGIETGVIVDTGDDDVHLILFDHGRRFELRGIREFEPPLLEGWIDDPSSGAEWDWLARELVFTDERTGEEFVRVSEHAVYVASAEAMPMETLALARWPAGTANPEWLIASPVEVFGEGALAVDFVGGDQQLLAIVTTSEGFEIYLADTSEAP